MNSKLKTNYETDFYAWSMHNAKLIREKKVNEIDFEHLAEEIESMGSSERRELIQRLALVLMHLLKSQYQSARRGTSWKNTIIEQRFAIQLLLEDSPSLRHELDQRFERAYEQALRLAVKETGMNKNIFPVVCPFTVSQVLNEDFYPEE